MLSDVNELIHALTSCLAARSDVIIGDTKRRSNPTCYPPWLRAAMKLLRRFRYYFKSVMSCFHVAKIIYFLEIDKIELF